MRSECESNALLNSILHSAGIYGERDRMNIRHTPLWDWRGNERETTRWWARGESVFPLSNWGEEDQMKRGEGEGDERKRKMMRGDKTWSRHTRIERTLMSNWKEKEIEREDRLISETRSWCWWWWWSPSPNQHQHPSKQVQSVLYDVVSLFPRFPIPTLLFPSFLLTLLSLNLIPSVESLTHSFTDVTMYHREREQTSKHSHEHTQTLSCHNITHPILILRIIIPNVWYGVGREEERGRKNERERDKRSKCIHCVSSTRRRVINDGGREMLFSSRRLIIILSYVSLSSFFFHPFFLHIRRVESNRETRLSSLFYPSILPLLSVRYTLSSLFFIVFFHSSIQSRLLHLSFFFSFLFLWQQTRRRVFLSPSDDGRERTDRTELRTRGAVPPSSLYLSLSSLSPQIHTQ